MSRIWVASLIAVTFFVLLVLGYLKPVEFPVWVYWLILFVLSFALPIYGTLAVAFVFLFSRKRNLRFELSRTLVFLAFLSGVSLVYVDWDSGFKTLVFLILGFTVTQGGGLLSSLHWKIATLTFFLVSQ